MNLREKIRAEITEISDDGMKLKYQTYTGRLRVIDYEWDCVGVIERMNKKYKADDFIDVIVINAVDDLFLASHKDCFPGLNPWGNPDVYSVGKRFNAVVIAKVSFGYFLRLSTGAAALLKNDDCPEDLGVNEEITVVIKEIDFGMEKIGVVFSA